MDHEHEVIIADLNIDRYTVQRDAARIALNYLNNLQSKIYFLTTTEPYNGRDLPVREIYEPRLLLSYIPDPKRASHFTIYICNLPLDYNGYMLYDDNVAFITLSDYHEMGKQGLPLDAYIAFHVAKIIAYVNLPMIGDGAHHKECPIPNSQRGDSNGRLNIQFGKFCKQCLENISHPMKTRQILPGIKDAVDLILHKVSQDVQQAGFRNSIPYDSGKQESAPNKSEKEVANKAGNLKYTGAEAPNDSASILKLGPIDVGAMADKAQGMPDSLNYESYARILADFITHDKTETPLAIALSAKWGRGKTFLADLIRRDIEGSKKAKCIWFNAWYFAKASKVWFHFCSFVLKEIVRSTGEPEQIKYHVFRHKHTIENILREIVVQPKIWLIIAIAMVIIVFSGVIVYDNLLEFLLWVYIQWQLLAIIGVSGLSLLLYAVRVAWRIVPRSALRSFISDPYSQETVFDAIARFRDWHNKNNKTKASRRVIFIDDIDRCPPEEMVGVLEALQLFLKLENVVFVLALDVSVVCDGIGTRFKFVDKARRSKIGREYLEKIIQIPFHIPEPNNETFVKFMQKLFQLRSGIDEHPLESPEDAKRIKPDPPPAPRTPPDKPESDDKMDISQWEEGVIKKIVEDRDFILSPRLAKRFRNIYMISRTLLKESNIPLTQDLASSFFAWLALSVQFPEETKALHDWFVFDLWQPFPREDIPWLKERQQYTDEYQIDLEKLKDVCFLENVDRLRFRQMMSLYLHSFKIENNYLEKTQIIYNCFNLILD